MSGYSQRGGFTLTWNIENFAYSGLQKAERLKTPFFYAYSKEWCLMLYPRGKHESNYISLEYYANLDGFEFLYSILDSEGAPLTWEIAGSEKKYIDLVRRDEVFGPRKTTFLPDNALTIQCRILKKGETFSPPLLNSVRTRIQDNRHLAKWEILKFCSLAPRLQIKTKIPEMTQYGSGLNLILYLDDEGRCKFNIQYIKERSLDWAFATCKVKALDATGKHLMFAESEHFFESNNLWQFTSYITKSMLMCDQNLFLPNGTLTLMLECTLSSGVEYSNTVDAPSTASASDEAATAAEMSSCSPPKTVDKHLHGSESFHDPSDTLSQDLLRLYETGILSDFNLSVGDETFPVHKQVLGARSPEFRAMFTADMKESKGIEMKDIDAVTLQRMIRFMYTDAMQEDLEWKEIFKLYVAAEKYKLQSLKDRCTAFLQLREKPGI